MSIFRCLFLLFLLAAILPAPLRAAHEPLATGSVITSAAEFDYPPFSLVTETGEATGFAVELLRTVLKTMGYGVDFKVGPWSEVKQSLVEGRVQVLPLVGRTPEREEVFDFTFPYLKLHGALMVRDDQPKILGLDDLNGRQVAVLKGDNAEEFLRRGHLGATIVTTDSFETALRELSEGKHDAVVIQKLLATQLVQKLGITNLRAVGPPLQEFTQSFCFAVPKGQSALLGILNEGLSIVFADGTFAQLHHEWFTQQKAPVKSRIVVGGDKEYPPYEYLDQNGQPTGFNVELTRAIAKQLNLNIDIRLDTWSAVHDGLSSGRIDVVQGMFYSPERDRTFDFSPAHAIVGHSIVTRRGEKAPQHLNDLKGKSILVMRNDIMHDVAINHGYEKQLVLVASQEEALRRLAAGEQDCVLVARIPALYWIEKNGWQNLEVGAESLLSPEYCYATLHGERELLVKFSEALETLKKNGTYRAIYSKWFNIYEDPSLHPQVLLKYALYGLTPVILLLLGVGFWNTTLKRQVAQRTLELEVEMTERKKAEQQRAELEVSLRQKHKMEAIGLMAGGIAHNFNNNLAIIMGNLQLADLKLDAKTPVREHLEQALIATRRSCELVRQIMAYSRQSTFDKQQISMAEIIAETIKLLRSTMPTSVDLSCQIPPALNPVLVQADASRIQEALINLCNNAVHAMQEKGRLQIELARRNLNQRDIPAHFNCTAGEYLRLRVQDNGCGMQAEVMEKIFDPFYTTKEVGKGTGIGLSTVMGIIHQHQGFIQVDSTPGQGATFDLYFPVSDQPPAPAVTTAEILPRGSEHILFVDDETMLVEMVEKIFTQRGYVVTAETSSSAALQKFKQNPAAYDLLMTDQTMPELTGCELIRALREIRADLPVILCSGYSSKLTEDKMKNLGIDAFFWKPVEIGHLLHTTRKILDEKKRAPQPG